MGNRSVGIAISAACIGVVGLTTARLAWSQRPLHAEPPPAYAKGNKQKIEAYVVLLRLRHDLYLRWKESGKWPNSAFHFLTAVAGSDSRCSG
jgi:hypothetical protein